jgi:hypothetical protein
MRTEMKNAIGMTERSNAELARVRGDNSELSNDQLESVAGGFGLTPAVCAAISTVSMTPTWNASLNSYLQQASEGVPPSQQQGGRPA